MRIDIRGDITEGGKACQRDAGEDAAHGDILCYEGQEAPDGKCAKSGDRSEGKENTESGQNAFTAAEARKASKAVAENREQTADKRKPEVIRTARSLGSFVHP